ncbi:NUDIX domain-containing protein [Streptomyces sp. NPDC059818]|uniref:NUDIX domain-containing protein n=1 Tax=Streptomyces sp. NPDC059818 TaxID=3346962 RepID=UPI003655C423
MMEPQQANTAAWERYGAHHIDRRAPLPVRRRVPDSSRPRASRPPVAHTAADAASLAGHSTAVLLVNSAGQYLLHLRDAHKPICDPGTWSLVGGGPEGAESLDEAVVREIREETGLVIPGLVPFARTRATGPHVSEGHIQVYAGQWDGDAGALPVTEGIMFRWFDVETMEQLTMCAWAHRMILAHHRAERAALPPRNPVIVQKDQSP